MRTVAIKCPKAYLACASLLCCNSTLYVSQGWRHVSVSVNAMAWCTTLKHGPGELDHHSTALTDMQDARRGLQELCNCAWTSFEASIEAKSDLENHEPKVVSLHR